MRLEDILHEADRPLAETSPAAHADLANRVRRGIASRRRHRRVAAGTAALFAAAVTAFTLRNDTPAPTVVVTATDPQQELTAIRREIELRERGVAALLAAERIGTARAGALLVRESFDSAEEQAAAAGIWRADRVRREPGMAAQAEAAYADVLQAYPHTVSAGWARKKLDELRKDGPT